MSQDAGTEPRPDVAADGKAVAAALYLFPALSNAPWWRALEDPPRELAEALLTAAENTAGVFWVGTTLEEVL